jgi:DNA replication and repair protein RecF
MALHGVAIAAARLTALDALAVGLVAIPETAFPRAEIALAGSLEAGLRHQSALEVEDTFRARLAQARRLDGAAGRTLEGPHRSDLQVIYAAKNMAAADCSTGEQKALLVGLILAQAHSVAAQRGDVPILLLDEVAAHLDRHRRGALAEILHALGGQSWITGTDNEAFDGFETVFGPAFAAVNMAAKMTETDAGEASLGSTSS